MMTGLRIGRPSGSVPTSRKPLALPAARETAVPTSIVFMACAPSLRARGETDMDQELPARHHGPAADGKHNPIVRTPALFDHLAMNIVITTDDVTLLQGLAAFYCGAEQSAAGRIHPGKVREERHGA